MYLIEPPDGPNKSLEGGEKVVVHDRGVEVVTVQILDSAEHQAILRLPQLVFIHLDLSPVFLKTLIRTIHIM